MNKQNVSSFQEYSDERFTKRIIYKNGESTVFILNFLPGQELPAHTHPGTDVYLLVMDGEGAFTIDGENVAVTNKDAVHVTGTESLAFKNTGTEPVSLYVMLTKIPDERYAQNI